MIKDKISEIYDALMSDEELSKITIKSFERPETLPTDQTSIVIIPLGHLSKVTREVIQAFQNISLSNQCRIDKPN